MQQQQRKFARVWFPSHRASSSPNVALNSIVDGVTSELLGNAEVQHAVPLFTALVLSCHMIPGFSHPFGQSSATRDQLAVPGAPNLRSTRQRDSLGPLLFMAGLLPALQSLREEFPPTVTILAYFDDLLVVGRPDDVLAALSGVAEALARVGLDLNKNKFKLLATLANLSIPQRAAFAAHGIPPAADHLEFLGAIIGPPERVAGFFDHKLHTFQANRGYCQHYHHHQCARPRSAHPRPLQDPAVLRGPLRRAPVPLPPALHHSRLCGRGAGNHPRRFVRPAGGSTGPFHLPCGPNRPTRPGGPWYA